MYFIAVFFVAALAFPAHGADAPLPESVAGAEFADIFDFSQATKPRPGDWLEYLIAFPADPLESSLASSLADNAAGAPPGNSPADSLPADSPGGSGSAAPFQLLLDPPVQWRIMPVRLHIREVDDAGCNAEITFADGVWPVRLDAAPQEARAAFHYDEGGETERRVRVGGNEYAVTEVRRGGSGYGFVRWFSTEIPFGMVRFATEQVDLQLVGLGRGAPPDFPIRLESGIAPALGGLY
jgi:hypothetical protein